ncbi:hypothetical protein HY213_03430 [Candidatus Peregrinibacteria bacterium]|nr:hypothetical protein [Candidatus Peregrinibacteria bacterium]
MLNILSGMLSVLAFVPYIAAILRGQTQPSRVSWWIWSAVGLLLALTYVKLGSTAAVGVAFGSFAGQVIISALAIPYGKKGVTIVDRWCLVGALACAILWWLISSPLLPHLLILGIDFFAWLSTFRKAIKNPASENLLAWILWFAGGAIALVNVHQWTIANALFPLYVTCSDGLVVALLFRNLLLLRHSIPFRR